MHPVDLLILEIAAGRIVGPAEIDRILQHVATTGYPDVEETVGSRLAGVEWKGRILKDTDRLPYAEIHFLRHVKVQREWPEETTFSAYLESIRDVLMDPDSGVAISRWQGRDWHLTVVRRSGPLRGPDGHEWLMIEYAVGGHWTTAFQMKLGLRQLTLSTRRRADFRWLRDPK